MRIQAYSQEQIYKMEEPHNKTCKDCGKIIQVIDMYDKVDGKHFVYAGDDYCKNCRDRRRIAFLTKAVQTYKKYQN